MSDAPPIERVPLPAAVRALLDAFHAAFGATVRLRAADGDGWSDLYAAGDAGDAGGASGAAGGDRDAPGRSAGAAVGARVAATAEACQTHTIDLAGLPALRLEIMRATRGQGEFLAHAVDQALAHEREARSAARELTERYEEINLLYSISEILASVMSVSDAATRILSEVADVLGARRASLWVYRAETDRLHVAAAVGEDGMRGPIALDDEDSATAWVFREKQPLNLERGTVVPHVRRLEPRPQGREAFLSVPISYTPPGGEARTVGVVTLVGRRSNVRFSAGDARLLAAIASQIGAALETQRLFQESLRQERMLRELELAHDLQLKLLPDTAAFEGPPEVAGRCVPAESVGGDFYQLFRLPGNRLAVVIGDVSSHGFSAALIMALTLSAVGIYASEARSPGDVFKQLYRALADELESTEMFLTLFYGVLDLDHGKLTYASAGHPHAFRIGSDGDALRLEATSPPLGLAPIAEFDQATVPWRRGRDLLLLFTDGLSDALADDGAAASGEGYLVEEVVRRRGEPLPEIVRQIFLRTERPRSDTPADDRTALLVRG